MAVCDLLDPLSSHTRPTSFTTTSSTPLVLYYIPPLGPTDAPRYEQSASILRSFF
jgi:hypothetical protein